MLLSALKSSAEQPILPYGSRRSKSHAAWRAGGIIVSLIAIACVGVRAVHQRWPAIQRRWWIHQCLTYHADPNQPVHGAPACWEHFVEYPGGYRQCVFLHARTNARGVTRLVEVALFLGKQDPSTFQHGEEPLLGPDHSAAWTGEVYDPAKIQPSNRSWYNPSHVGTEVCWTNGDIIEVGQGKQLVFFNGQPNPNDPSRFTFRYQLDGVRGTIEGHLADNDAITLNVLDGPAFVDHNFAPGTLEAEAEAQEQARREKRGDPLPP